MKKIAPLFLIFLLSFKTADIVELEKFVNARITNNYVGKKNVQAVLAKGTKGKILEISKLPSGNQGIKLEILSGQEKGKKYWVYFDEKNPSLVATDGKISVQRNVKVKRDIAAIRDPQNQIENDLIENVSNLSQIVNKTLTKAIPCSSTQLSKSELIDSYDETMDIPPFKEVNESTLSPTSCQTKSNYEVCKNDKGSIESFKIRNGGPNNMVKTNEYYINREFSFEMEDKARSDLKLLITDSPDDFTSHSTYSVMVFLPRKNLPSIINKGDTTEVTLPTNEKIVFNSKTKEIISGVLTESPMAQEKTGKAKPAGITYTGSGVLIRADKSGDLPYGDIETSNGTKLPSNSTATISKKGFKDCKIPSKDLWYTDYNKGDNVFIKKELSSDEGMDNFLKAKCGFSIF